MLPFPAVPDGLVTSPQSPPMGLQTGPNWFEVSGAAGANREFITLVESKLREHGCSWEVIRWTKNGTFRISYKGELTSEVVADLQACSLLVTEQEND